MTDPFDALRVAYEQGKHDCAATAARGYDEGQRDAINAARKSVEAIKAEAYQEIRDALLKTHLAIPVIECACGWGVNCPECGPESNRTVGFVCRVCCDEWGDHGYCDDMHNDDDSPVHHQVGGEMWSGPYCPVIAVIDALSERKK